jgi:threonine dehydrogenase-like Zn-dependent dehydrogenase
MQKCIQNEQILKLNEIKNIKGPGFSHYFIGNPEIKGDEECDHYLFLKNALKNENCVDKDHCIPIPKKLDKKFAVLIPTIAKELKILETVNLEIGELVIVTGEGIIPKLFSLCALWHGARYVIQFTDEKKCLAEIQNIKINQIANVDKRREIAGKIATTPGFVAIDTIGKTDIIDHLLELLPVWGRLILMGDTEPELTIDYYNNVHRKAAHIITSNFNIEEIFNPNNRKTNNKYIKKSIRIVINDASRKQLEKLVK